MTTSLLTPMTAAATGLAILFLVQIVLLVKLARSTRVTADATSRVTQLTAALALLTDTTEEGFVNVAAELERLGAKPTAPAATRRATTKRIVAAVRKGKAVEEVAIAESLSESEVRLHLGLDAALDTAGRREPVAKREKGAVAAPVAAAAVAPVAPAVPAAAADAPGVLDDIERWMTSIAKARPRGISHAAVRV